MKVIYESKRPRYVVQRRSDMSDWEDECGDDDLKKPRIDAAITALLFPREYVRIIDTQEDA